MVPKCYLCEDSCKDVDFCPQCEEYICQDCRDGAKEPPADHVYPEDHNPDNAEKEEGT